MALRPFPPLSAAGSGRSSGLLCCCASSARMGLLLACAALVWIVGIATFLSGGGASGLSPSHSAHSHHSHKADMRPRGFIAEPNSDDARSLDSHAAGVGQEEQQPSTRGFGLYKLAHLQKEIQSELHNIFLHDSHYEGTRAHEEVEEQLDETEQQREIPLLPPAAQHQLPPSQAAPDVELVPAGSVGFVNPAIVVLTYKRRGYLLRTLDSLMVAPGLSQFTLYVSQDAGPDVPDISDLPAKYSGADLHVLRHKRVPLLTADQSATAYLAQHYKWVLDRLFLSPDGRHHSHVVIMEDDMLVAPDFLTLFSETAPLLDSDPTLLCVSSWNDLGMSKLVADPQRLMRTDYFPGLGWMTNKNIWSELSPIFPLDQWDHFMRLDTTHRGRDCLIPEVARNHNIGAEGTNMGDSFYQRFLAPIAVATRAVSFKRTEEQDPQAADDVRVAREELEQQPGAGADFTNQVTVPGLEHLRSPAYEVQMRRRVRAATLLGHASDPTVLARLREALSTPPRMPSSTPPPPASEDEAEWLVLYERPFYPQLAMLLGVLSVPRSVHRGLSSVRLGAHLVWLADVKKCPYLPLELQFHRDPSLRPVVARQDESCTDACERETHIVALSDADGTGGVGSAGMVCSAAHFQFLNECSALLAAFPSGCSKGCRGGVSGLDVPNHVDNPAKPELYGYCLTTEDEPTCAAKHWSASRLCPCVNRS